jgi:ankyrin repeat protein
MTPLHFACQSGSFQIVCFLVEHNADISNALAYSTTDEIKQYLQGK